MIFLSSTVVVALLASISLTPVVSGANMNSMLMAQTLESFLASLVFFGAMSETQKYGVLNIIKQFYPDYNSSVDDVRFHRREVFSTKQVKDALVSFLYKAVDYKAVDTDNMEFETAEVIASMLNLGALTPRDETLSVSEGNSAALLEGPVGSVYTGDGNIIRLGRSDLFGLGDLDAPNFYNGIWGYSVGSREYALQCHGDGLNILDVTDPDDIFRVQFVPMPGGGVWRDVATHVDTFNNKAFAYVGAQGNHGDGGNATLFAIDLSTLSGAEAHAVDENPALAVDLGQTPGETHTINVARGLLFLNTAMAKEGCRVYDLVANPMNPRFLFKTGGSMGYDCHDSSVITDVDSRDLLIVSDGSGRTQRIWDITDVDENWTTNDLPLVIGHTEKISGIYAHSNWASEDKRYLFCFEEANRVDIAVHDISDPTKPKMIGTFQYSDGTEQDATLHNGEIRGNYLYVAYYKAGLRVFDISNPYQPVEVGKTETYRDPNGDGVFENPVIDGIMDGAWNTYPYLSSENILVSDILYGVFVVKAKSPYSRPGKFTLSSKAGISGQSVLSWDAASNARGYSVLRSSTPEGPFEQIAEHLINEVYVDELPKYDTNYYKVVAINGEGIRESKVVSSTGSVSSKAGKQTKQGKKKG